MTSWDHVLTTAECASVAERRLSDRPIHVVPDEAAITSLLGSETINSKSAQSITFFGPWRQLTVRVSRLLAEWAIKDPARGCGLYLSAHLQADEESRRSPDSTRSLGDGEQRIVVLSNTPDAVEHTQGQRRVIKADEMISRTLDPNAPRLTGLALTGHGAEYCIQFGPIWLSTFDTTMLGERVFFPTRQLASVVLLNGCSTLRLGDSSVPERFSLARTLFGLGCAVIGSFRNLRTSPAYAAGFADALLTGATLGQVVNRLNIQAVSSGAQRPPFQLLGDAMTGSQPRHAILQTFSQLAPGHCSPSIALERAIDAAAWLEKLHASFIRWVPQMGEKGEFRNAYFSLIRSANRAARAIQAQNLVDLSPTEIELVVEALEVDLHTYRNAALLELARFIQFESWLQSAYAPLAKRICMGDATCNRCGELSMRAQYLPFASHLLSVDRWECDRCGTLLERIGDSEPFPATLTIQVRSKRKNIEVSLPPLEEGSSGVVFFHRMPSFSPLQWPINGGDLLIPHNRLSFKGRLTVVVSAMNRRSLSLHYYTLFIEPDFVTIEPSHET